MSVEWEEGKVISNIVTVAFETRSPRSIPVVGQNKRLRVNGHVEHFYVKSVSVKERLIDRAWSDGSYSLYCGEIVYERVV